MLYMKIPIFMCKPCLFSEAVRTAATMTAGGGRLYGEEHAALPSDFVLYKFRLGDKQETICNLYDQKAR